MEFGTPELEFAAQKMEFGSPEMEFGSQKMEFGSRCATRFVGLDGTKFADFRGGRKVVALITRQTL